MTIIISGPITNPSFHIAESLAHHLHLNLPSFEIRIDPHKSQQEYQNYLDKLFREKGWWNRRAVDETFKKPEGLGVVVYRSSGELIGMRLFPYFIYYIVNRIMY